MLGRWVAYPADELQAPEAVIRARREKAKGKPHIVE
jgi:hypothetical protein